MSSGSDVLIRLEHVSRHFFVGPTEVRALDGVDLEVPRGKMVAVTGPSGCGKTTLLNLLGALDAATEGRIIVDSVDITKLSGREQVSYRRTKVGFVFQTFQLIPNISAEDNVMLPMEFNGLPARERRARAHQLLLEVGIPAQRFAHHPLRLSGGEQQRVAIARALANAPLLILADEPTGNVNSRAASQIVEVLRRLTEDGQRTVLVVTHNAAVTDACDAVVRMQDGRITGASEAASASTEQNPM